ncbi:MAG TPA: diguanylate cyclase, partial [Wenzhouxiangella sp.]|nr:diguanylate cyclase [Wenzhouxiangella sp.]
DIGILALRAALTEDYQPVLEQARDHDELIRLERESLKTDHGEAGSWLMAHWKLPEKLVNVPARVHDADSEGESSEHEAFYAIVAVAAKLGDLLLGEDTDRLTIAMMSAAGQLEGLDPDFMEGILDELTEQLPDMAALYDTEIISTELLTGIVVQSRQVLTDRDLVAKREAFDYEQRVARQAAVRDTRNGEEAGTVESASKDQLDERLNLEFQRATNLGHPLSLAFVRLDDYEKLIEQHGPNDVAKVLQALSKRLAGLAGQQQLVFSSGRDEFVVLLLRSTREQTRDELERLRSAITKEEFRDADEQLFKVTISIGMACHMDESLLYERAIELLGAADQALRGLGDECPNSLTMAC